jgi:hypothetical protein
MFPGLRDLRGQHEGIVVDACTTEFVTRLGQGHDHRPAPVQTDTHDLPAVVRCLHGVASLTVRSVSIPSIPAGSHEERGPAPSCHQASELQGAGGPAAKKRRSPSRRLTGGAVQCRSPGRGV